MKEKSVKHLLIKQFNKIYRTHFITTRVSILDENQSCVKTVLS